MCGASQNKRLEGYKPGIYILGLPVGGRIKSDFHFLCIFFIVSKCLQ